MSRPLSASAASQSGVDVRIAPLASACCAGGLPNVVTFGLLGAGLHVRPPHGKFQGLAAEWPCGDGRRRLVPRASCSRIVCVECNENLLPKTAGVRLLRPATGFLNASSTTRNWPRSTVLCEYAALTTQRRRSPMARPENNSHDTLHLRRVQVGFGGNRAQVGDRGRHRRRAKR